MSSETTPETDATTAWSRPWVLALGLALLTLAVYLPAIGNDFVNYDDDLYVTANPRVAQGLSWDNAAWAFTTTDAMNWHPLTWLSYMTDAQLFGPGPRGFHATSVVLHALCAGLLFLLLRGLTGENGPSLFAAALFALHPLNVQSVAWVAERKNVLCMLFALLALIAYGAWTRRPRALTYAAVLLALAASLMGKSMTVTLPFVMLLLDYWPLRRFALGQARLWLEKLPFFAAVAAVSYVTYVAQKSGGSVIATGGISWSERFANAAWSYLAYLGKMLWPAGLAAYYPHPENTLALWRVAGASTLLVAVTVLLWLYRERLAPQLVGWLWYLGTLVPVLGIVQVGTQAMADRYAYVPLVGIFIAIAWTGAALVRRGVLPARVATGLAAVVVAALAVRTVQQIGVWHDSLTLFEHTVKVEPTAWVAHYNLGNTYEAMGRHEDAIGSFRETIRLRPEFARAHNNLGNSLDAMGRHAEALPSYERAVQLKPDLVEAYNNLGIAYAQQGRDEAGLTALRTATLLRPDFVEAYINLAIGLRHLGRLDEARAAADRAVSLRPDLPVARYQRALVLLKAGDREGVQRDLQVLQTQSPELAARLGTALTAPPAPPAATGS